MDDAIHHARTTVRPFGSVFIPSRHDNRVQQSHDNMGYPPCPYPPCSPGSGISMGETGFLQKTLTAECTAVYLRENTPIELDWHRPSSGTLVNSPRQINPGSASAEDYVLSNLNLPQLRVASPPKVALPSSPERKEILLVSSASTFSGDEDVISVSL
jgi:hypothetical protein